MIGGSNNRHRGIAGFDAFLTLIFLIPLEALRGDRDFHRRVDLRTGFDFTIHVRVLLLQPSCFEGHGDPAPHSEKPTVGQSEGSVRKKSNDDKIINASN